MGFYIQDEYWEAVEDLSDKEQDAYFGALARLYFANRETEPKAKNPRRVFLVTKDRVRLARIRSDAASAKRDANGVANEGANEDTNEDTNKGAQPDSHLLKGEGESKSKDIFIPPSREEAEEYLSSINLTADLDKIFDHYEANGWKCGRNPMKDWRAAFRRAAREWAKGGSNGATSEYADVL